MKLLRLAILGIASVAILAFVVACGDDANDEVTADDRENFEAQVRQRIDRIDDRIKDLSTRINQEGGNARDDLEEELESRRDEREQLDGLLRDLRNANDDEWREMRDRIDDVLDDLEGLLEDI